MRGARDNGDAFRVLPILQEVRKHMIDHWQSGETTVGRLRIAGVGVEPITAQLRLSALLNNAAYQPAALSPSALVFIRSLNDPLPRSLSIKQRDNRPPAAWWQAYSATLDRLVAGAARPALGAVPSGAGAVVFLDRSELLACMASDLCEGRVSTNWWWQTLLKKGTAESVKELWASAPEYVPAALNQLAKVNQAERFVSAFSEREAFSLLTAVARRFSLEALSPVLNSFSNFDSRSALVRESAKGVLPIALKKSRDLSERLTISGGVPWGRWVRESVAGVATQQALLGITLMLRRAPDVVRSPAFALEVESWWRELALAGPVSRQAPLLETESESVGQADWFAKSGELDAGNELTPLSKSASPSSRSQRQSTSDVGPIMGTNETASLPEPADHESPANKCATASAPLLGTNAPEYIPHLKSHGLTQKQSRSARKARSGKLVEESETGSYCEELLAEPETILFPADQSQLIETTTETRFGGLFYLINLALYLGLYGDFTTPGEPGIALNICDFVALVGRELIGESVQRDPLWTLLARLAAREASEEPGRSFEPVDEWRLPAEWLHPFPSDKRVYWSTRIGRLRLIHNEGFLMLDVPLEDGNPAAQLQREMKPYAGFELRVLRKDSALERELETRISKFKTRDSRLKTGPAIAAWLVRLLPYVRARLRRALGLKKSADPALLLCRHTARVCTTATHVDVFFKLADLPVAIRFAGLDRDPGWVPSAGRYIAYHFE